jgi:hypothetical protein
MYVYINECMYAHMHDMTIIPVLTQTHLLFQKLLVRTLTRWCHRTNWIQREVLSGHILTQRPALGIKHLWESITVIMNLRILKRMKWWYCCPNYSLCFIDCTSYCNASTARTKTLQLLCLCAHLLQVIAVSLSHLLNIQDVPKSTIRSWIEF